MNNSSIEDRSIDSSIDRYATFELFSKYYMALLILLGTFGNGFCIVAYMTSDAKRYGSTRYLIALSISDLGFVVCMALTWIKTFGLNWQAFSGICEVSTYLSSVCCLLSGWYVTALSGERWLAVRWPYVARRICSPSRTTLLIIFLAFAGAAINAPLFYVARSVKESGDQDAIVSSTTTINSLEFDRLSADHQTIDNLNHRSIIDSSWNVQRNWKNSQNDPQHGVQKFWGGNVKESASGIIDHDPNMEITEAIIQSISYRCGVDPSTEAVYRVFTTIDTVVSFSMPLILTLVLNVAIAYSLCRAARERRSLTSTSDRVTGKSATTNLPVKRDLSLQSNVPSRSASAKANREEGNRRNALITYMTPGEGITTRVTNGPANNKLTERKITSVLVAKCIAYLILNLPSYLHRIVLAFEAPVGDESLDTDGANGSKSASQTASMVSNRLVEMLVYLLFYTQFSTNFLLYSFNACVNGAGRLRRDSFRKSCRNGRAV